jgi:uncharacterized protein
LESKIPPSPNRQQTRIISAYIQYFMFHAAIMDWSTAYSTLFSNPFFACIMILSNAYSLSAFMLRNIDQYLLTWLASPRRKPLVLRGARQVGKTYAVRQLATQSKRKLVELNLDHEKELWPLFTLPPAQIISELAVLRGLSLNESILFIDEIQACPAAIHSLRYFYEQHPELCVIAAGSLLDFALSDLSYSMPVGRVEFAYLSPLNMEEFARAVVSSELADFLANLDPTKPVSETLHKRCLELVRNYYLVGGMPAVVEAFRQSNSFAEAQREQSALLQSFEVDFLKYGTKSQHALLAQVYRKLPSSIGKKTKFNALAPDHRSAQVKAVLELLRLAGIVHFVHRSASNGIPLHAERDEGHYKPIYLDIGLAHHALGLRVPSEIDATGDLNGLMTVMEGAMAEQFVGQELIANAAFFDRSALHYWHREAKNSNAEVDYLVTHGEQIIPIEVKAGVGNSLRSLHQFVVEKNSAFAYRLWNGKAEKTELAIPGTNKSYTLQSLPLYYAGKIGKAPGFAVS